MANRSKTKGDVGEREALAKLRELIGHLLVDGNDRAKSAGIPHDRGDLHVLDDTAVQVKHWKLARLGSALLAAAHGAVEQAACAHKPYGLGLCSIEGARKVGVRWLACVTVDEAARLGLVPVAEFKSISPLRQWVVDDEGPLGYRAYERHLRVCSFTARGSTVIVAPVEAWAAHYEDARLGAVAA